MDPKKFYLLEVLFPKQKAEDTNLAEVNNLVSEETIVQSDVDSDIDDKKMDIEDIENKIQKIIDKNDETEIQQLIYIGKELRTLELNRLQRVSNRFDGNSYYNSMGIDNFSKVTEIEETVEFADEVDKLCESGLDRRTAYSQARYNIYKRR